MLCTNFDTLENEYILTFTVSPEYPNKIRLMQNLKLFTKPICMGRPDK